MRRSIVAAAVTLLCVTAAWGAEIPQSVTDAVPPEAAGLLQDVGNTADHETLWAGLSDLWHSACAYVRTALESRVSGAAVLLGIVLVLLRVPLTNLFTLSDEVKVTAQYLMIVNACIYPLRMFNHMNIVGTFRAGGDTRYGLIIDCITMYLIGLPLTMLTGLYLHWSVPMTYLVMYLSEDIIKCSAYLLHFRSYKWIRPVI